MATTRLRPMSIGEILDASFALLRHHAGVFFGIAMVCHGVPTALDLFVQFGGGPSRYFGLWLLAKLLAMFAYLLVTGASIRVVSQAYLGHDPHMGDALSFAVATLGRTLMAGLAAGVLAFLAAILTVFLLFVPGIIVACGLAVAVQAAVLEPLRSATDGVGRSWSLTKGFKWKAFGLFCVTGFLFFFILFGFAIVGLIAAALYSPLVVPVLIGLGLISLFIYPFTSCVYTLFYYDLRVRKEAFDLEILSRNLGIAVAAT